MTAPLRPRGERLARLSRPAGALRQVEWRYATPIVVLHLLALLALWPWLFSWTGVVLLVAGVYFYGGVGINLCYHRLLTHRSFKCPVWLERVFVTVAVCCLQDAPAGWVAAHRLHHRDADDTPDPHSPLVSFFWSHVGWLLVKNPQVHSLSAYERYARDVLKDRYCLWLQRGENTLVVYGLHAAAYFLLGAAGGAVASGSWSEALRMGLSVLVWGVILRTVVVWHITWSVNSLSHLFGYRSYETGENSQNNWLVAALTSGEGWHNNHHADPASASNWRRWWEVDLMWLVILAMERVGLAWGVVRPRDLRRPSPAGAQQLTAS
ncbi:acyl-CoA desaturase [Botrimarina sp.]|uniref:acyl-CoA desaturase n=1 Tax=Botrimarina sp. TaxID=2795802 RepID=UPI0032F0209E